MDFSTIYNLGVEVTYYAARLAQLGVSSVAIISALLVILKFTCGLKILKFSGIKYLTKGVKEPQLANELIPTPEQKKASPVLTNPKMNFIRRTMITLCIATLLFCINFALYILGDLFFSIFAQKNYVFYVIFFSGMCNVLDAFGEFFYYYVSCWCICYGVSVYLSVSKTSWSGKGCSIKKYDIIFHFISLCVSSGFFMLWAVQIGFFAFAKIAIAPLNLKIGEIIVLNDILAVIEAETAALLCFIDAIMTIPFFALNALLIVMNFVVVRRYLNIERGKLLGIKTDEMAKRQGFFVLHLTKFLFVYALLSVSCFISNVFFSLLYLIVPLFDLTESLVFKAINYIYYLTVPLYSIILFIFMLLNFEQIYRFGCCFCGCCCCCYCCLLGLLCCRRRKKEDKSLAANDIPIPVAKKGRSDSTLNVSVGELRRSSVLINQQLEEIDDIQSEVKSIKRAPSILIENHFGNGEGMTEENEQIFVFQNNNIGIEIEANGQNEANIQIVVNSEENAIPKEKQELAPISSTEIQNESKKKYVPPTIDLPTVLNYNESEIDSAVKTNPTSSPNNKSRFSAFSPPTSPNRNKQPQSPANFKSAKSPPTSPKNGKRTEITPNFSFPASPSQRAAAAARESLKFELAEAIEKKLPKADEKDLNLPKVSQNLFELDEKKLIAQVNGKVVNAAGVLLEEKDGEATEADLQSMSTDDFGVETEKWLRD